MGTTSSRPSGKENLARSPTAVKGAYEPAFIDPRSPASAYNRTPLAQKFVQQQQQEQQQQGGALRQPVAEALKRKFVDPRSPCVDPRIKRTPLQRSFTATTAMREANIAAQKESPVRPFPLL
jgi:hypothetical protein